VCGEHKLKTFSRFILQTNISITPFVIFFFKLLRFFGKGGC